MAYNDGLSKQNNALWRWLALIAVVLLLGGGWIILSRSQPSGEAESLAPAPIKGHPSPEISLVSTDGELVRLSDFEGKPVVINFWATWCPPCRAEMPDFQAIQREMGDEVVILSVNATSQDGGDVEAFMREFGMTFTVVKDTEGKASKDYNVLGLPTTVFVARDGTIHEVFTGAVNKAYIESTLSGL